jgi:hypothetical protein
LYFVITRKKVQILCNQNCFRYMNILWEFVNMHLQHSTGINIKNLYANYLVICDLNMFIINDLQIQIVLWIIYAMSFGNFSTQCQKIRKHEVKIKVKLCQSQTLPTQWPCLCCSFVFRFNDELCILQTNDKKGKSTTREISLYDMALISHHKTVYIMVRKQNH